MRAELVQGTDPVERSGSETWSLEQLRLLIDALDEQVLSILARRFLICREIARYKHARNVPMLQPNRAKAVVRRAVLVGQAHGMEGRFIYELYTLIVKEGCRLGDSVISGYKQNTGASRDK